MSYFAKSRPDAVGRNVDADDDADSTFSKGVPSLPALAWAKDAVISPECVIIGATAPSSAFLDAVFPSDAAAAVATLGSVEVRSVAGIAGAPAGYYVAIVKGEVSDELAAALPMAFLSALTPKRYADNGFFKTLVWFMVFTCCRLYSMQDRCAVNAQHQRHAIRGATRLHVRRGH